MYVNITEAFGMKHGIAARVCVCVCVCVGGVAARHFGKDCQSGPRHSEATMQVSTFHQPYMSQMRRPNRQCTGCSTYILVYTYTYICVYVDISVHMCESVSSDASTYV